MATVSIEEIRELIKQELPTLVQQDPEIQRMVLRLARQEFAPRQETEDRFTLLLEELRRDREEQSRKWNEQSRKWDDQNRKWDENQQELKRLHEEIMAIAQKHDRSIGALGARWGTSSEAAFRNALAAILEKSFGVRVINIQDYDDDGTVFGRPEQVELDVIIVDGMVIIVEIKSSVSKADMYLFERKARFYERKHQRQVSRMMVISPMIDTRALKAGETLKIEMYSDSIDVQSL